jgi:hypothetical protein
VNLPPRVPNNINKEVGYVETREPGTGASGEPRRQQRARLPRRHGCGGCANTWTGLAVAHCATCHRTFGTVGAFDRHRSQRGPHGACHDPAELPDLVFRADMWRWRPMPATEVARRRR